MVKKLLDTIKKIKCKKFNQTKFDIVYTYIDSTDKEWQKSIKKYFPYKNIDPQRYKDYGEIYFSLKTLEIFAKNICNNIYIVTDNQKIDETKISPWLKKNIKYVYHNEIIPLKFLPTFNSITIESFLHNIPNLTENFIYLNDDMFFGNFVTSDFFYNKNKCLNIFIRPIKKASNRSNNKPWLDYYLNVYNIFINRLNLFPNFAPVHTYYMMNKELCKNVWEFFNDDLNKSLTRIRNKNNINFWFLCFAMGLYKGYFKNKMPTLKESANIACYPGLTEDERIKDISIILKNRPIIFCYNNINEECVKYWEILKNNYLKDITTDINVVTFNILAHKYTNFTRGHKKEKETKKEMKLRYVNLLNILKKTNADIYCLQEVDELAAKFLSIEFKKKKYNYYHVYQDKNNGLLILWKNKYYLKKKFKKNITKSNIYEPQIAQFLILNINGQKFMVVNTILREHSDDIDIRKDELKNILKNIKIDNKTIICGDFNETNYEQIEGIVGDRFNIFDKYFKTKNFATFYHPWNLNKETNEMYKELPRNKYKSVDYLLYSKDLTVTKLRVKPSKRGVYEVEEPYKNTKSTYDLNKWPSDHALLLFTINL